MNYTQTKYNRRSIRLKEFDYSQSGSYFVTVCTRNRVCLFGGIEDENMVLNQVGRMIEEKWNRIPHHFNHVKLDAFQIMPNHIHGIIFINNECVGAKHSGLIDNKAGRNQSGNASPLRERPHGTKPGSLSSIMQNFLSITTRKINQIRNTQGIKCWQRNFHDRIIRNDKELNAIREYIINNPLQWEEDTNNPKNLK
jgi:putative transposase